MPIVNKKTYEKVAKDLGFSEKLVEEVYQNYWKCIKENIEKIPLNDDISEEEFKKYPTVFGITRIGKIYCLYDSYKKKRDFYNKLKKKEDEEYKSE